jgi:hypothetical protein
MVIVWSTNLFLIIHEKMWYKYSIWIIWERKENAFLATRACLLAFSHTRILPAETAVFPQKLDFELAAFNVEMGWKTVDISLYVLTLLGFNKLCLMFLFIWVAFIRESYMHAVNFNPLGDGNIGSECIYLKWIQVHIKIVYYAVTPCYLEFMRNRTESVFEISTVIVFVREWVLSVEIFKL